jgi:predicted dehydrogenase
VHDDRATLRLAAIGCGRVFERYHLPAIRACEGASRGGVRLVATCDPLPARREWAERALGVPSEETVEGLLHRGEPDAVLVATPPETHVDVAIRVLQGGAHVLVEKPMATRWGEAIRLAEVQRGSGRVLRVGFNRRYRPEYVRLRSRVHAAGGASRVHFTFVAEGSRWGAPALPGGDEVEHALHDAGSHALDLVAHIGAPIEAVRARVAAAAGDVIVEIEARLEGGASALCVVGRARRYREVLEVTDREGRARRRDVSGSTPAGRVAAASGLLLRRLLGRPSPSQESFRAQMSAFVDACRGIEDRVGAGAAAGVASVAAVDACSKSLATNGAWCDATESNNPASANER